MLVVYDEWTIDLLVAQKWPRTATASFPVDSVAAAADRLCARQGGPGRGRDWRSHAVYMVVVRPTCLRLSSVRFAIAKGRSNPRRTMMMPHFRHVHPKPPAGQNRTWGGGTEAFPHEHEEIGTATMRNGARPSSPPARWFVLSWELSQPIPCLGCPSRWPCLTEFPIYR